MTNKRLWLTLKRVEKEMTQRDLAKRLGLHNQTISKYELGFLNPSRETAEQIAKELDFDVSLFFKDQKE